MHTHNVNVKTAGEKRPKDVGRSNTGIIAEQQSLVLQLAGLWNYQMEQEDEAGEISKILQVITENLRLFGVRDWSREKPLVEWNIACWWVQAQKIAVQLYDSAGARAVESARADLADMLTVGKYEYRIE